MRFPLWRRHIYIKSGPWPYEVRAEYPTSNIVTQSSNYISHSLYFSIYSRIAVSHVSRKCLFIIISLRRACQYVIFRCNLGNHENGFSQFEISFLRSSIYCFRIMSWAEVASFDMSTVVTPLRICSFCCVLQNLNNTEGDILWFENQYRKCRKENNYD